MEDSVAISTRSTSKNWSHVAQHDLEWVHQTIFEGHPAILEKSDKAFHAWFKDGYAQALDLAKNVINEKQALATVRFYATGFQDGHLAIVPENTGDASSWISSSWAGWIMQKRGDDFIVTDHAKHWPIPLPPQGAKVLTCDEQSVSRLIETKIAPYVDQRLGLLSAWLKLAAHVSVDVPMEPLWEPLRIKNCLVELPDKTRKNYPVVWQESDEGIRRAFMHKSYQQSLRDLGDGVYWIHVSNFLPNQTEATELENLLEKIRNLDKAKIVILDTRGNGGGNSINGYKILKALLQDEMPEEPSEARAYWRVTPIAVNTMASHIDYFRQVEGEAGDTYLGVKSLLEQLRTAQSQQQEWLADLSDLPNSDEKGLAFKGQLGLVTDAYCASACLDFVDAVLRVPGVVHFGLPTSADTNYMDMTQLKLPSGLLMWMPLKIHRNRSRGSNQPHIPQFLYEDDICDTKALQKWVLQTMLRQSL